MINTLLHAMATEKEYPPAAADFAAAQIAALPPLARAGVSVLALLFYCHFRVRGGSGGEGAQHLPTACWRRSSLPACRDFVLLCDSLLVFYQYGEMPPEQR